MGKDVIIALDFQDSAKLHTFLDKFEGRRKPYVKVGMELFYSQGRAIVDELKQKGYKIFLDLKLHDIPNTVKQTMKVLSSMQVDMVNLHAAGTKEMMKAALQGLIRPDGTRPLLLAVTQLTSTSEERMREELLIDHTIEETVGHYAKNAYDAGLDGVVCSAREVDIVKKATEKTFLTVTPGIRFNESTKGDQVRVMTPKKAKEIGSDYIVVGRPITKADDPVCAYEKCVREFID